MSADPLLDLFSSARAAIQRYRPGHAAARVIVFTEDGRKALDALAPIMPPASDEADRLSELEADVIEALGTGTLTGPQIAEKAGYPYDKDLKTCLAAMRRRGILTGGRGDVGYSVAASP